MAARKRNVGSGTSSRGTAGESQASDRPAGTNGTDASGPTPRTAAASAAPPSPPSAAIDPIALGRRGGEPVTAGPANAGLILLRRHLFWLLLAFRIVNASFVQTFFQPDEFYQSLEPGWQAAFGPDSGAYVTWEWHHHLRSSLHPLLFATFYKGVNFFASVIHFNAAHRASLLVATPKLVQAFFAACHDFCNFKTSEGLFGTASTQSWITLLLSLTSSWQWFTSTRTFSNNIETLLTAAALHYWPYQWGIAVEGEQRWVSTEVRRPVSTHDGPRSLRPIWRYRAACLFAATAVVMRPTNIMIWPILVIMTGLRSTTVEVVALLREPLVCGLIVLICSTALDLLFYGELSFPPINFITLNVRERVADFYGVMNPFFYLAQGLPQLLTWVIVPATLSLVTHSGRLVTNFSSRAHKPADFAQASFAACILTSVAIFSSQAHKEIRFLYPLYPMFLLLASDGLSKSLRSSARWLKPLVATLMFADLFTAGHFLASLHQPGVVDVTHYLRREHEARLAQHANATTSVLFLMPCHSTPWRSHFVHPGITASALTCEPPLGVPFSDRAAYRDEADLFYDDPRGWIAEHVQAWPEYVAFFGQLEPVVRDVLGGNYGWGECWRGFNSFFHDDWRRVGDVVVWCDRGAQV